MLSRFVSDISLAVLKFERNILHFLLRGTIQHEQQSEALFDVIGRSSFRPMTLPNLKSDSVLWAVPKKRRSVEKRLNRKFGWPNQVWKPLVLKKNLVTCGSCGNPFEADCLCPTCYSKVKSETEEMQDAIKKEISLNPIDKEVVYIYKGEKDGCRNEDFEGKRIIEMPKTRPQWFSKNLLIKTTKGLSSASSIKPSDLA